MNIQIFPYVIKNKEIEQMFSKLVLNNGTGGIMSFDVDYEDVYVYGNNDDDTKIENDILVIYNTPAINFITGEIHPDFLWKNWKDELKQEKYYMQDLF